MTDTNICSYAYDSADPVKQKIAQQLIFDLLTRGKFTISTQVLAEFFNSTTRIKNGVSLLTRAEASAEVRNLAASATVYPVTEAIILQAMDAVDRYKLSVWDAIIWATAKENGETVIYTEDLPGIVGGIIEGIQYVNPFMPVAPPAP